MLKALDTNKHNVLPPIVPVQSPIPKFRYRRDQKASVAFADVRNKMERDEERTRLAENVEKEEEQPKDVKESRVQSAVSSRSTLKSTSSAILNEDDFLKSLLDKAGQLLTNVC